MSAMSSSSSDNCNIGSHFGPQDFRWSQWQSGILCRICHVDSENSSDSESVLMYIPNHLEVVKVRRDKRVCQRRTRTECPIDMIRDMDSERVTIWKTIWSLFLMGSANGFEGVKCGAGLRDSWRWVCRVNRK